MLSIIIPVRNQKELTQLCLDSLKLYTKDYQLILSDDASENETKQYLYNYKKENNIVLMRSEIPLGYLIGLNSALSLVSKESEYIVFSNSDVVFTPNWFEKAKRHFDYNSDLGILGFTTNSGTPQEYSQQHKAYNQVGVDFQFIDFVIFFCVIIKKEVIEKVGALDEVFGFGGQADTDYCIRAKQKGYKTGIARDIFIYHYGSASFGKEIFKGNVQASLAYANKNQNILKQKYRKQVI